jgi:hypothetical protein
MCRSGAFRRFVGPTLNDRKQPPPPMCPPTRTGGKRRNRTAWAISAVQTFSTWPNSRSTGVARPKIDTATLTRERDSSTSSTTPLKEAKGPSATRMFSPISKRIAAFGRSTPVGDLTFDPVGLEIRDRHRLLVGAEKTGHLGRVLDQVIDLVGEVAFDQHIAGEELSLRVDLAAAAHLDDRFGRNENILELFVQAFLTRLMATCMEEALAQATEMSGYFRPREITSICADCLVELRGFEPRCSWRFPLGKGSHL